MEGCQAAKRSITHQGHAPLRKTQSLIHHHNCHPMTIKIEMARTRRELFNLTSNYYKLSPLDQCNVTDKQCCMWHKKRGPFVGWEGGWWRVLYFDCQVKGGISWWVWRYTSTSAINNLNFRLRATQHPPCVSCHVWVQDTIKWLKAIYINAID